jgi:hypothetical protein
MRLFIYNIIAIALLLATHFAASAQFKLTGKVYGSGENKELLSKVAIINKTANDMSYTDDDGFYSIIIRKGDTLEFSRLGYFSYTYFVGNVSGTTNRNITLSEKKNIIEPITVSALTKYQRDSIARTKLYDKAISYEQTSTIMSPVTSLYQQFSKKYKDLRKFQEQYADMEKQKFIDTKYSYELVNSITKLEGDAAAYFMNTYPMEYNFARTSSMFEIKSWIKYNYKAYCLLPKTSTIKLEFDTTSPVQK